MKQSTFQPIDKIVKNIPATSLELGKTVYDLTHGNLMAIEITEFLDEASCKILVDTLEKYGMDKGYLNGNAAKVLESQHNKANDPDSYFEGASNHPLLKEPPMMAAIAKIHGLLGHSGRKVGTAYDPLRMKPFCPAIIREFHSTLKLHNDWSPREGKGWDPIQRVEKQWAFVLKLTSCEGGETIWYPRNWKPDDEKFFNTEDGYSYNKEVVKGYPEITFKGAVGTLIVFDCTCYHAVNAVTNGRRYTMGGFVGLLDNEMIVWS